MQIDLVFDLFKCLSKLRGNENATHRPVGIDGLEVMHELPAEIERLRAEGGAAVGYFAACSLAAERSQPFFDPAAK